MNTMGALLSDVWTEYVALWVQTIAYFFIACLLFRWQVIKKLRFKQKGMDRPLA